MRFLQTLTPRAPNCRPALSNQSGPLSRLGKGGGGKGQIRPWLPWERFCAQYGLLSGSRRKAIRIQRSRAIGFSGRSPEPFLHPFVGTKGCPRRVGVLTKPSKRLAPPQAPAIFFTKAPRRSPPQISANRSLTAAGRFDCVETHGLCPCRRLRRRACGRPHLLICPIKSYPITTIN